jgi:hypothetical protein
MQRGMMTVAVWLLLFLIGGSPLSGAELNPLTSWNDGASKKSIVDFVERVTREGGADYVKPEERIATFDHAVPCGLSSLCISKSCLPWIG